MSCLPCRPLVTLDARHGCVVGRVSQTLKGKPPTLRSVCPWTSSISFVELSGELPPCAPIVTASSMLVPSATPAKGSMIHSLSASPSRTPGFSIMVRTSDCDKAFRNINNLKLPWFNSSPPRGRGLLRHCSQSSIENCLSPLRPCARRIL
jgi:hypothetical protein